MANSTLATYRRISPHNSGKRTKAISKITIHHMSGKMTAKQCADYFATVDRDVSSNYCIGYDGSIAVSVDEDCRSWCSASPPNDQAAVTIEVSNIANSEKVDPEWKISDEAMAALIVLCADVCKRNGIKKLYYDGTTKATLTRHCMFTSTDCPGPYIKSKTDFICAEVNKLINAAEAAAPPAGSAGTPLGEGGSSQDKGFKAYVVRITCKTLNIRSGPGTGYTKVGQVKKGEAFTIVQEKNGWGKLKSGAGWIYLGYTEKVKKA